MTDKRHYNPDEVVWLEDGVGKNLLPLCPECDSMLRGGAKGGNMRCDCLARWYWSRGREKDGRWYGMLTRKY